MKTAYLLVVMCAVIACAYSLTCSKCDEQKCKKPVCKKGGIVKDVCGCCDVCAKLVDQPCGGPWDLAGRCDKGLSCVVRKHGVIVKPFMRLGKCEPAACKSVSCPSQYHSCEVVNNQTVCQCPRHCKKNGQKVCGIASGKEYENECELRKYECKRNIKIPFKYGPCKRCAMDGKVYKFGEQIRVGLCELCSCAHGVWNCKNTFCLNQNTKNHKVPSFTVINTSEDNDKPKCPAVQCDKCKYGYIVDDNGCKTCECKSKKNICRLPKNPGKPCGPEKVQVRRFFFNYKKGKCEAFVFLGCHHNSNNFKTRKACEARCLV